MGKSGWRRDRAERLVLEAAAPGSRAVFLVEVRGAAEQRKVCELFQALAELADVAPLCAGTLMAYAVQLRAEAGAPGPLFSKIEAALREEFAFSLVERSFNSVIYHLVISLCEDSEGQMHPVPHCGICNEPEPFPTRVSLLDETGKQFIQACYCLRCAAQRADPDDRQFARDLLAADRRGWGPLSGTELVDWPENAGDAIQCPGSRLAS